MRLFTKLVEFYQGIGWEMLQVPNETILSVTYGGKNGQWTFVATTDETNQIIVLFARFPDVCPAEKYPELSIFLEKSNFGMSHGAWVMDRTDGEIRFRVGVDVGGLDPTSSYIRQLTLYTNMTMERYFPGIQSIIQEGKSSQEAFELVFPSS